MIEELWSELLHFVETLVSPDWGSLIAMIPLILAGFIASSSSGSSRASCARDRRAGARAA